MDDVWTDRAFYDDGELFGAITCGLRLNRPCAAGSDGRLGNDFIEVKTIAPHKTTDRVRVKTCGNFNKLLIVRINQDFAVSSRLIDRKALPPTTGKHFTVRWSALDHLA